MSISASMTVWTLRSNKQPVIFFSFTKEFTHLDIEKAQSTTLNFQRIVDRTKSRFSWLKPRVSIQGVKSLWGDRVVFLRLGTGDTDMWRINLFYAPPVSVPSTQSWKIDAIPPKWFNSLDTNSTKTTIYIYWNSKFLAPVACYTELV